MIQRLTKEQRKFVFRMKISFLDIIDLLDHMDSRYVVIQSVLSQDEYDNDDREVLNKLRSMYIEWKVKSNELPNYVY